MSCYEWERGEIKLPTNQVKIVREAVRQEVDAYRQKLYDLAQKFWRELPASYKRDPDKFKGACERFIDGNLPGDSWRPVDPKLPAWQPLKGDEEILWGMRTVLGNTPRRAKWEHVDNAIGKPSGANWTVHFGDASIEFKGRNVIWYVSENNHACDRAHAHPFAIRLFNMLSKVQWTRGSGGDIVGNNEYARDAEGVGGGGNYLVQHFGPVTKKAQRDAHRMRYGW